jgi:hypothetical protein
MRIVCVLVVCLTGLGMVGAASALAADTEAPAGAPPEWLPNEEWVQNRWLPYDERDLTRLLHSSREGVRLWLQDPTLTLNDLVRRKGLNSARIQRRLLRRWRHRVSRRQYRRLRSRTRRTFTQSHLMVHMIGHLQHMWVFNRSLPSITGVSNSTRGQEQAKGKSLAEIGAEHGHSFSEMQSVLVKAARANAKRSVRMHATPRGQARRYRIAEERGVASWLNWKPRNAGGTAPGTGSGGGGSGGGGGGIPGLPVPASQSQTQTQTRAGYSFLCAH